MNIYVGNLHFNVSEDELRKAFEEYGEVASVKIITDKYSGRSKGFGFVEMLNDKEANDAIENLNGTEIKGRSVNVNQAREKENNSGGGGGRNYRSRS
ncbi:MAG TPA: RNA-binding protein [Bacteroidales bacterium]|nr:RNA-binding protein [Bacteroidales bacterium]